MRRLLVGMVLVATLVPSTVQAASGDKAAAEALFTEGRRLMEAGRYPEACPKFEASQRLDPGVGTMLNLAECYEKTGRTASAWAEFREVISAAKAAESRDREDLARTRASALEGKLSRLTIALSPEASATQSLEVRRDGAVVDPAELGSAIPVDPGKHVIEVNAPGKQKWFTSVELAKDGAQTSITIPALAAAPGSSNGTTPPGDTAATGTSQTADTGTGKASRKPLAMVIGGVGVVGLGVGGFFGLRALSKKSDAKDLCHPYPTGCEAGANSLESDAKSAATLSTVAFAVGGVALATGIVLFVTAGSDTKPSTALVVGPSSLALKGKF